MDALSAGQIAAFQALLLGFAFSGLLASAFQMIAHRPPSFRMLLGRDASAIAAVPLLAMTAPVIILRNTLRGRRFERRPSALSLQQSSPASGAWPAAALCCGLRQDFCARLGLFYTSIAKPRSTSDAGTPPFTPSSRVESRPELCS